MRPDSGRWSYLVAIEVLGAKSTFDVFEGKDTAWTSIELLKRGAEEVMALILGIGTRATVQVGGSGVGRSMGKSGRKYLRN